MLMHGRVSQKLVPIMPVGFKDRHGEWKEIRLLLDTGFNGQVVLDVLLLDKHDLATWPNHQLLTLDWKLDSDRNWGLTAPLSGELNWFGRQKEAGIRLVGKHPWNGMVGTDLLNHLRLTVDVVEGGLVTVMTVSPPPERKFAKLRPFRDRHFRTEAQSSEDHLIFQAHELRYDPLFPWAILDVPDSKGRLQPVCFNVDTGDNGELGLTSDLVYRLGLRATGKMLKNTTEGLFEADQGEVEISWDRRKRTAKWSCVPDGKLPVIGMRLLRGKRITMYFGPYRTILQIHNIPGQPRPNAGLLHSLRRGIGF